MRKVTGKFLNGLKKVWPLILISFIIIATSAFSLIFHHGYYDSGNAEDFIYRIESNLLDWKFRNRGPGETSGLVGILAIDEKTINTFGEYPFNRRYYRKSFENLKKLGVNVIGFDVVFAEPQRALLKDAEEELNQIKTGSAKTKTAIDSLESMLRVSPADSELALGIEEFENIVLGYFYFITKSEAEFNLGTSPKFDRFEMMEDSAILFVDMPEGKTLKSYPSLVDVAGIVSNYEKIGERGSNFAFFSNEADEDAINRWVTLVSIINGQLMPSLALKTAAVGLKREIMVIFGTSGIDAILLIDPEEENEPIEIGIDPQGKGRVLVNHRGPGRTQFPHYSLADAYMDSFTEEEKENLKGSLLLLGATATGTNDIRPNPFDPAIDGVENHAAVMDNIIKGDLLRRDKDIFGTELIIVLLAGFLFAPVMIWGRAIISALAMIVFITTYYYVDKTYWWGQGTWTYMAVPMLEILSLFIILTLVKFMTEEKDKKFLKEAFGSYISPELIDEMYGSGKPPQLGGDVGILTAYFTDIQSFSSFSEKLSAPKLVELLNEYLTAMTDILLDEKGTLDKYEGDAIIAFFGAPMELRDHATRSVTVAVRMQNELLELRKKWVSEGDKWPDIVKNMRMRIGVNSGEIVTGNMGSRDRMNYTMMGDSVNLAARLEEAAKQYGIFTHISHFTKDLCEDKFVLRELDTIRVVGKSEPVTTFDVLGIKGETEEYLVTLEKMFSEGLAAYKSQQWQAAIEIFRKTEEFEHQRYPEQKDKKTNPSKIYVERCEQFIEIPPPSDWDGVFTLTSK